MKIRTDFVTNSLSSSFIVSIGEQIPEEINKYFTNEQSAKSPPL